MKTTELFIWDGSDKTTLLTAHTEIKLSPNQKRGTLFIHQDYSGGWAAIINGIEIPINKGSFQTSVFHFEWSEDLDSYKFYSGELKRMQNVPVNL